MKERHHQYNPKRPIIREGDVPNDKELDVWKLLATGMSNKWICFELDCSESNVKTHIGSLLTKMGVTNRVELALLWHGIDISTQKPRVPTERDLRDMVARDCYNNYRAQLGLRETWDQLSDLRKDVWRNSVTMGVTLKQGMFAA